MKGDEVISQLYLGEPSSEILEWAKKNIRENPDTRCQMISDFRDMIYSRGECTPHRTDDKYLLRFLRARNFSIDAAYKLLVSYYDFKEENPELFEGIKLSLLDATGKCDILVVPPYRDQTGRRMIIYKCGNWNPEAFSIEDALRATLLVLELAILEDQAQILGGRVIFDMDNISVQQAWHMTPSLAKKLIQIMVTAFPIKVTSMHIVNQSWIFDTIFNCFKPFLHPRMTERLFFHGDNMESLHEHIHPKSLPTNYGGVHPWYDYKEWTDGFRRDKEIVQELESLGYIVDNVDGKD